MNSFKMDIVETVWKTKWMSDEELGFYTKIMWFYHHKERGVDENLEEIFAFMRVRSKKKKAIVEKILLKNFKKVDGLYIDEDIEKDIKKHKDTREKNRKNGSLGGNVSVQKKREKIAS